jgi:hypothetical protein
MNLKAFRLQVELDQFHKVKWSFLNSSPLKVAACSSSLKPEKKQTNLTNTQFYYIESLLAIMHHSTSYKIHTLDVLIVFVT